MNHTKIEEEICERLGVRTLIEALRALERGLPPPPRSGSASARGPPLDGLSDLKAVVDFRGLKRAGIVANHPTLLAKIRDEGFPPGFWIGANSHRWYVDDVMAWLSSRPTERPPRRRNKAEEETAVPA